MQVTIKDGREYEYVSDFDNGWVFSKGDYFKFPVNIGSNNCFIKRFEKKPEEISGWKLLDDLKEKNFPNLTRIYDVVKTTERQKIVYYVFLEFNEGQTLYDEITRQIDIDLKKFTTDLFTALTSLHAAGHWFPDFLEKNIFCTKTGRFLLIDLDSTEPIENMPDNNMWGSKDYWALVFSFCKEILHYKDFKPSQFNGISFNCLHAIFLILRLKVFYETDEDIDYFSDGFTNRLPGYLDKIHPSFKAIFSKIYHNKEKPIDVNEIAEIRDLVLKEIIPLSKTQIEIIKQSGGRKPNPVINKFEVSNYVNKKEDEYTIENGKNFTLRWSVSNGQKIELLKNNAAYKQLDVHENSIDLKESAYDGNEKRNVYTLVVSNTSEMMDLVEQASLTVKIVEQPPAIEFAILDYAESDKNYYAVESGKPYMLTWDADNARQVAIKKNGQPVEDVNDGKGSLEQIETVYDGRDKKIKYELTVSFFGNLQPIRKEINVLVREALVPELLPVIQQFKANINTIKSGDSFKINWVVENAASIVLYKNGEPYKILGGGDKKYELTEKDEGKGNEIKYSLIATNAAKELKSDDIIIAVTPRTAAAKLVWSIVAVVVLLAAILYIIFHPSHHINKISFSLFSASKINEGDIIDIAGENLPQNSDSLDVKFNNIEGRIIQFTKDGVEVQVPTLADKPQYVNIVANVKDQTFSIAENIPYSDVTSVKPSVNNLNITSVAQGDVVTIFGENLPVSSDSIIVTFNKTAASIIQQSKDSLWVSVPALQDNSVDIMVQIGDTNTTIAHNLPYRKAQAQTVIYPIAQKQVTPDEPITIFGDNIPQQTGAVTIKFNNTIAPIVKVTANSIIVNVPSLSDNTSVVKISTVVKGKVLHTDYNIGYQLVTIINPATETKVSEGQTISFFGKNIPSNTSEIQVLFNNVIAKAIQVNSSMIEVQVPLLTNTTEVKIDVKVNGVDHIVANNIPYQKVQKQESFDLCQYLQHSFKVAVHGFLAGRNNSLFGGRRTVTVTLKNTSKYFIDSVLVKINYRDSHGLDQTQELVFESIQSLSATGLTSKEIRDINVNTIVIAVNSVYTKEFGKQTCK